MTDESLWGAMERLRVSTVAGIDQLEAGIAAHKEAARITIPEHDCPWVGTCHCVREGSLCRCSHQKSDHGSGWDYEGRCAGCPCEAFRAVSTIRRTGETS